MTLETVLLSQNQDTFSLTWKPYVFMCVHASKSASVGVCHGTTKLCCLYFKKRFCQFFENFIQYTFNYIHPSSEAPPTFLLTQLCAPALQKSTHGVQFSLLYYSWDWSLLWSMQSITDFPQPATVNCQ